MPNANPETLIARLKRRGTLTDQAIEAALRDVRRELFLPGVPLHDVYQDESITLKRDARGLALVSSTAPSTTVQMLQQLELQPGHNVLQIGAGSGYTAALIQHVVGPQGRVTAVEIDRTTVTQAGDNLQRAMMGAVNIVEADGVQGYAPRAEYDRIIVNATVWDIPDAWQRQLKVDGILVAPLWLDALQYSGAFRPVAEATLRSERNVACTFVPLRGGAQGPRMDVRIGGSALTLTGGVTRLDSASLHILLSEAAEIDYLSRPLTGQARKRNFLAYLMLNLPREFVFCLYNAEGEQQPYGMNQRGFAVLARGSVAFVSMDGDFKSWIFGGADAFIAAQETYNAWLTARMPGDDRLHICLAPHEHEDLSLPKDIQVYRRPSHDVCVWLD